MKASSVVGVFGGSFNPVHSGHMMLASYIAQFGDVDSVMLMLSPCNPLKKGKSMASDSDRFNMLLTACNDSDCVYASDLELSMPRPSYTIDTLRRLEHDNPGVRFKLIIGSDNWAIFNQWRASEEILDRFGVIVYPRRGYPVSATNDSRVQLIDAPMIDISSTFIRNSISLGKDMNYFLPSGVYDYICQHNLYQSEL